MKRRMQVVLSVPGFILFWYLWRKKKIGRMIWLMLSVANLAAAVLLAGESQLAEHAEVKELSASAYPSGEAELEAQTEDGERHEVKIQIPEKPLSEEAAEKRFTGAEKMLRKIIPGKNKTLDHVVYDLELPSVLDEYGITVSWSADRPEILRFDGQISSEVKEDGCPVELTAVMHLQNRTKTCRWNLTVYPSLEEHAFQETVQAEGEKSGTEDGVYLLPETVGGRKVTWYQKTEKTGARAAVLLFFGGMLAAVAAGKEKEKQKEKKKAELSGDYPVLVSKLYLLLAAGLSMRKAWEKLAVDYQKSREKSGCRRAQGEEILYTWYEMQNGISEGDAYLRMGERCALPAYKGLALILAQNRQKGGNYLLHLLEQEAASAMENKKRKAREAGEKTSLRLLLPTGMMLMIVLALVLIPAMLSF